MNLLKECDLGQQSILHAVQSRPIQLRKRLYSTVTEEEPIEEQPSKPLCETLVDLQLHNEERSNITEESKWKFVFYKKRKQKILKVVLLL